MAKLELLITDGIRPEHFNGTLSYRTAMWTISVCNRMIELANKGHIIFHYENIIKPQFVLEWDGERFEGLYLKDSDNCRTHLIGDCTEEDGRIHCRKYEIREFFKLWRIAKITDTSRVTDLV